MYIYLTGIDKMNSFWFCLLSPAVWQVKELKHSLTEMQTELQDALQRATSAAAKEQKATQESQQQVGLPIISQFHFIY